MPRRPEDDPEDNPASVVSIGNLLGYHVNPPSMDGSLRRHSALRAWAILLVAIALALVVYPLQPFTGSLPLVVALALVLGAVAAIADALGRS